MKEKRTKRSKSSGRKLKSFKSGDKDVKFENYSGKRDLDKALLFIRQLEVAFANENFKESSKLRHVSMHLKGTASPLVVVRDT